jgi:hypothetical protein
MTKGGNLVVVVVVVVTTVVCVAGAKANCPRVVLGSTRGTLLEVALLVGLEALPLLKGRRPPPGRDGGSITLSPEVSSTNSFQSYRPILSSVLINIEVDSDGLALSRQFRAHTFGNRSGQQPGRQHCGKLFLCTNGDYAQGNGAFQGSHVTLEEVKMGRG